MFGRVLLRSKEQILPFIEKMLKEYIDEFRVRMNEKISKRKGKDSHNRRIYH